jgi:hypothetical protein
LLAFGILAILCSTGCLFSRKAPYANDPLLIYYKPTLDDSATILAERASRHEPVRPPMPAAAQAAWPQPSQPISPVQPASATQPAPESASPQIRPNSRESYFSPAPAADGARKPVVTELPKLESTKPIVPMTADSTPTLAVLPDTDVVPAVSMSKSESIPPEQFPRASAESAFPKPAEHHQVAGRFGHAPDYHWLQGVLEKHYRGYFCLRYLDPSKEDPNGGKVRLIDDHRLADYQEGDVLGMEGYLHPIDETQGSWDNPRYQVKDVWLVRKQGAGQ